MRTLVIWGVAILTVGLVGVWIFWMSQPIVPNAIRKQLPFSPLVYTGGGYQATGYKYAAGEKVLSYVLKTGNDTIVTMSEQSLPTQFIDIPEYKDRFLDNVTKRYATVQASDLTVYLTRPPKQQKQVGVIVDKGLLIFMTAERDLSEAQWRKLADALAIEKVQGN